MLGRKNQALPVYVAEINPPEVYQLIYLQELKTSVDVEDKVTS